MENKTNKIPKKYNEKYTPCFSDKNTPPYNDVIRVITNPKTGKRESIFVKGLTEEQKIAEGTIPPYQYQPEKIAILGLNKETGVMETVATRTFGRFEKSLIERKELKEVHTNKPHKGKWAVTPKDGPRGNLIVHLKNSRKGESFNLFKTTHSFSNVSQHEIFDLLSSIITLNDNKKDDNVFNYVTKYYYLGKVIFGKAN